MIASGRGDLREKTMILGLTRKAFHWLKQSIKPMKLLGTKGGESYAKIID